jgi:hypothetical protein
VETAVLFPTILLLTLLVIEAGLWWHARQAALSAAQQGFAVAATQNVPAGLAQARSAAEALGGMDRVKVWSTTGSELTVHVSGSAPSIVPGISVGVAQAVSGPVEAYEAP